MFVTFSWCLSSFGVQVRVQHEGSVEGSLTPKASGVGLVGLLPQAVGELPSDALQVPLQKGF